MRWRLDAEGWIRKLHYYVGLYCLAFLWLFCISGLLLNHPGWRFAEFWPQRKQAQYERAVKVGAAGGELDRAHEIMSQLGIRGEVEWTVPKQAAGRFRFRVTRPGRVYEVEAEEGRGRARVTEIAVNGWGVLSALHHFNGVRMNDTRNARDWFLTGVWTFCMDALAAGLLFILASGVYVWWRSGRRRLAGRVAMALGIAASGLFLMAG
jgi:hypothetical protein